MKRSLLIAEPIGGINGKPVLIATTHLESGDRSEIRKQQLELTLKIMNKSCENNIVLGDFNFHSTWADQQSVIIDNNYTDVLLDLKGEESFTMGKTLKYEGWRPDKIIIPKGSTYFKPREIKIVGNFCIPQFQLETPEMLAEDGLIRTPSDHYALLCDFDLKNE